MMTETTGATDKKVAVRMLDAAGAKAGYAGASSKQTWYLAGLLEAACERDGRDLNREVCGICNTPLTKRAASNLIDLLKSQEAK